MKSPTLHFMTGFRVTIHAREGVMLGIRDPWNGPIFRTREEAEQCCIAVMVDHFDRGLGMSDAKITPFAGMVSR